MFINLDIVDGDGGYAHMDDGITRTHSLLTLSEYVITRDLNSHYL